MKATIAPVNMWRQLPLDLTIAFGIIAVSIATGLSYVAVNTERARMTEAVLWLSTMARTHASEHIALEGVLTEPAFTDANTGTWMGDKKYGRFVYQQSGTSVLATGVLRAGKPPIALSFHPAAPAGEPGWSVIWICGAHLPPAGWSTSAKAQSDNLVAAQLPAVCKN